LDKILKSSAKDEVVDNIHGYLRGMADDIRQGKIPLKKFAITKSLTKSPEDYKGDSKSQPHVQVALAMRQEGQSVRVGDVIPYIICKAEDDKKQLIGERAFHPETVKKKNLQIDLEWYFTAQIHPPIARLIEPLDGTDNVLIAQCLGLDPTKFGIRLNNTGDPNVALPSLTDDSVKYKDVEKLVLKCPSCSKENEFLGVWHKVSEEDKSMDIFACTLCSNCKRQFSGPSISNAVTLATRKHIGRYYSSPFQCDERTCSLKTREFNIKSDGQPACPRKGCSGTMSLEYDKNQLYTQLRYFQDMFDYRRHAEKLDMKNDKQQEEYLILTAAPEHKRTRELFDEINVNVTVLLQQNGYGVVDCAQLFGFFKM
jgi:DNA polymerase alpha subunit A